MSNPDCTCEPTVDDFPGPHHRTMKCPLHRWPSQFSHEAVQHRAAYGDVCGPAAPPEKHLHERETLYTPPLDPPEVTAEDGPITRAWKRAVTYGEGAVVVQAVTPVGLTEDAADRKATPICSGVLDYFPDALAEVARCSRVGNEQHNPGEPLHWAKEKSTDEADALVRHLIQRGTIDTDGVRHSAKVAWRALALLQRELDALKG